ncbi:MAG: hypothetical protein EKK62_08915 [Acidimicrobiia bacterium]|nr:PQQ-binding-like beta-propeller repeat protein [Microthrixaceae bacterium]RTL08205.1 MAG: hypothetical protein EKK62_08915 [Acidimicrobiia bacterium]
MGVGAPVQVPLLQVSVVPIDGRDGPAIDGATVFTGAATAGTVWAFDAATALPPGLVAVTRQAIVEPASVTATS